MPVVILIAVSSTFLGLFIAVSVSGAGTMPTALNFAALTAFCLLLFAVSLRNIRRKWIV
ncbi:MAG: hypothetical protein R6V86_00150 [Spirochaetia bacterium]